MINNNLLLIIIVTLVSIKANSQSEKRFYLGVKTSKTSIDLEPNKFGDFTPIKVHHTLYFGFPIKVNISIQLGLSIYESGAGGRTVFTVTSNPNVVSFESLKITRMNYEFPLTVHYFIGNDNGRFRYIPKIGLRKSLVTEDLIYHAGSTPNYSMGISGESNNRVLYELTLEVGLAIAYKLFPDFSVHIEYNQGVELFNNQNRVSFGYGFAYFFAKKHD